MTQMQEVTTTKVAPFIELFVDVKHWWKLPLRLRQRWWTETDYGQLAPSPELIKVIEDVIAGKPYDDPKERPPADQKNVVRKEGEEHVAATHGGNG